uniref:Hypotheticial protein n=1 Tax=Schistosoma japonicum TaxID=6182 RepID=C7TXX8_SCHJA|nr:hypotheticial protein [Schistosoma japonicum]
MNINTMIKVYLIVKSHILNSVLQLPLNLNQVYLVYVNTYFKRSMDQMIKFTNITKYSLIKY